MRIVYAIPTANAEKCNKVFPQWNDMGYETVAYVNDPKVYVGLQHSSRTILQPVYHGWSATINLLARMLYDADIIVAGGDDMSPDPSRRASDLGAEFVDHFKGTLGIMQPHGDNWSGTRKICGSPWLGREWCDRGYSGGGPMWGEYFHFFADEELFEVGNKLGLLWCRNDVSQYHEHWLRVPKDQRHREDYTEHNKKRWGDDKALFHGRKAAGFPGHQLKGT